MTETPSRSERREQSRKRSRVGLAVGIAVVVVIAVVVGALVFSSGGDDSKATPSASSAAAHTKVTLDAGDVTADSVGAPVTVPPEVTQAAMDTIGSYVKIATVNPLRTAKPAADLAEVFDPAALARVISVDRAALVDEGLPKVTGDIEVVAKPVAITGLGDQDGKLTLLTASIDLDVTGAAKGATAKAVPLHIVRSGSFVFTPDASGAWRVSAYSMIVNRAGGGIDPITTTTTTAGTSR
jgi:hypothetical protein